MTAVRSDFVPLAGAQHDATRDALAAYARVLGNCRRALVPPRKHWWHISLRPWLTGFETGPIHTEGGSFNLELSTHDSRIEMRSSDGAYETVRLAGQSANSVHASVVSCLNSAGFDTSGVAAPESDATLPGYDAATAKGIGQALSAVATEMNRLRHGLREETSPVQLWPHHFDLALLWLSGRLIEGADPADAEHADEQVNIGFSLGDATIAEPYFYITAYPAHPDWLSQAVAAPARWHHDGFTAIVASYADVRASDAPAATLQQLWRGALTTARQVVTSTERARAG